MSFKRFVTINVVNGASMYDDFVPVSQGGDYMVDDSHFVPMSEAVKQLDNAAAVSSDVIAKSYDFVDGKDTGSKVPVDRLHDVKDLAELSVAVRESEKDVKDTYVKESYNSKIKSLTDKSKVGSTVVTSGASASSSGSK